MNTLPSWLANMASVNNSQSSSKNRKRGSMRLAVDAAVENFVLFSFFGHSSQCAFNKLIGAFTNPCFISVLPAMKTFKKAKPACFVAILKHCTPSSPVPRVVLQQNCFLKQRLHTMANLAAAGAKRTRSIVD